MTDESTETVDRGVRVSSEGGVARVVLCRPEKRNAFDDQVIARMTEVIEELSNDKHVRVIVLEGDGKVFSAGADLDWMRRMVTADRESNVTDALRLANLYEAIHCAPKAVIAKVHGAALGGGAGLAAAADIAVAAEGTIFGFTEARLGILPSVISPYVVMKIGAGASRRWFVTGSRMDAAEAHRIGLIHEVVPAAELEATVLRLAMEVLQCGPQAVGQCKELVEDVVGGLAMAGALENGFENVKAYTATRIAEARVSPEGQEGLAAFLDKRKARWAQ
jgi:methylglutaconyl-CoA hydratase